ncbi:MAG: hypothetical protein HPY59_07495 [Anaerolineae bacterium]|nr:hypothetical protein [Anaerolineae bacterium]
MMRREWPAMEFPASMVRGSIDHERNRQVRVRTIRSGTFQRIIQSATTSCVVTIPSIVDGREV